MAVAYRPVRSPQASGLADVLDVILDKGLVIDAYVRVSLVGIELLTVDLRVVVASVDTYLRFAEAVNRLELGGGESRQARGLPEVIGQMQEGGGRAKARGALGGAMQSLKEGVSGDGEAKGESRSREGRSDEGEHDGGRARSRGPVTGAMHSLKETFSGEDEDQAEGQRSQSQSQSQSRPDESESPDEGDDDGGRQPAQSRRAPEGRQAPSRG